jgi:hypothetical protein
MIRFAANTTIQQRKPDSLPRGQHKFGSQNLIRFAEDNMI